jgi:hypothetical protein
MIRFAGMELKVQIVRYVDDHFTGWVECEFFDAENNRHSFVEKAPVVSDQWFGPNDSYPQNGSIRCEILESWHDVGCRELVRVTTERPDCVEIKEGKSEFVVLSSQVVFAEATIVELEKKAREYEERSKTEPDRIATALRHRAKQCRESIAALRNGHWR